MDNCIHVQIPQCACTADGFEFGLLGSITQNCRIAAARNWKEPNPSASSVILSAPELRPPPSRHCAAAIPLAAGEILTWMFTTSVALAATRANRLFLLRIASDLPSAKVIATLGL